MKELVWDNSLSVQVQEIDEDHRRLVDLFNILNRAIAQGEAGKYVEAVIEELLACTAWHFKHEERLMLKYDYAQVAEHKAEHKELIENAQTLQQKFLQQGKSLSNEDIEYLEHWLTGHIFDSDMELGKYLCEAM